MLKVIVTCEHAGNIIPKKFQKYFLKEDKVLSSHEGLDIGAFALARDFAKKFPIFFYSKISRLLIELNRSLHHPKLFSKFTKGLNVETKEQIVDQYYLPYREEIDKTIKELIKEGYVILHLSVHSFTGSLNGDKRTTDIGLLYDPKRKNEKNFSRMWQKKIKTEDRALRVRMNYPYLGTADGFVTALRKKYKGKQYIGLELEVNQDILKNKALTAKVNSVLLQTFENVVKEYRCLRKKTRRPLD